MDSSYQNASSSQHSSDASGLPSPTDPRALTRYESLTGRDDAGLSESLQSSDTIRRRSEATYGMCYSYSPSHGPKGPSQPVSASDTNNIRPHYPGSIQSPSLTVHSHVQDTPERGQSRGASQVARSPLLGPDRGRPRPRKPPMARRASSNAQAPHRGEVFSVDDGISEVEAEQIGRMQNFPQASTLRRRAMAPALSRVHSSRDDDEDVEQNESRLGGDPGEESTPMPTPAPIEDPIDEETTPEEDIGGGDDEDDDISDAESFTLKDRQQAINETHPFGIRLWKPALYKKDRSVQKNAEGDIHSSPGGRVSHWLLFFNIAWTLCFGWWLALIAFVAAVVCFLFAATRSGREYGQVLWGLAGYLLYPFGKFVRLEQQEPYIDEDQGEGRSISEYEQWQSGDLEYGRLFFGPERGRSIIGRSRRSIDSEPSETDSLLGRTRRGEPSSSDTDLPRMKRKVSI